MKLFRRRRWVSISTLQRVFEARGKEALVILLISRGEYGLVLMKQREAK